MLTQYEFIVLTIISLVQFLSSPIFYSLLRITVFFAFFSLYLTQALP